MTTHASTVTLDGWWVGGLDTTDGWAVLYARLQTSAGAISATIDLPLLGVTGLRCEELTINGQQLSLTLEITGRETRVTAEITDDTIVGEARDAITTGRFHLVRTVGLPADFPSEQVGIYTLGPGHDVFIGNITGAFDAAYHDFKTGRIGVLFPRAQETYVAGPELLIPFPTAVEIQFVTDAHGRISGLQWLEDGQPPVLAAKINFVYERVTFSNDEVDLAGTIVLPAEAGPHPGVVIVHGSGPQTREMVQLYAESFARRGIAALIYDKRGTGESSGHWESDYKDLARDALAAVQLLQRHPDVQSDCVGLCGASQAGWIMPIAAARSNAVAFAVLLVSPAVSIAQQNILNVAYSMRASGFSNAEIEAAVAHIELFNREVCTGEHWDELQQSAQHGRRAAWAKYAWSLAHPRTAEEAANSRQQMERDPLPILQQVTCPLLAIFGGSDTVVPYKENLALMQEALQKNGHADVTFHVLPHCTHLFTYSETGADADFPRTTHWLPEHLDIVADWINARSTPMRTEEAHV